MMCDDELTACLGQRELLLTRIRDFSRRIEVRSALPDASPADLIAERQIYLDRLKKCAGRIAGLLARLPDGEGERVRLLLSGRAGDGVRAPKENSLREYGVRCRALLREISASDSESLRQMEKERDRIRKLAGGSRKGRGGLFSHSV